MDARIPLFIVHRWMCISYQTCQNSQRPALSWRPWERHLKVSDSLPVSFRSKEEPTRSAEALLKSESDLGRIESAITE